MATMTTNSFGLTVYEDRRGGFHPCSYEDYLEFRRLHWRVWCWMKMAMIHHRWERKHPDNRKGTEPIICKGQVKLGLSDLDMKKYYQNLLMTYRRVRMPETTADAVPAVVPVAVWEKELS